MSRRRVSSGVLGEWECGEAGSIFTCGDKVRALIHESEAAKAVLTSLFPISILASYTISGVYETNAPCDFDFGTLDVEEKYEPICL